MTSATRLRSFGRILALVIPALLVILWPAALAADSNTPARPNPTSGASYLPFVAYNAASTCAPLYFDDFSNPASGWTVQDTEQVLMGYVNGEYQIMPRELNDVARSWPAGSYQNYRIAADVRPTVANNGTAGLMFGLADGAGEYYTFEVNTRTTGENTTDLALFQDGTWGLLGTGYSTHIKEGLTTNHLEVVRNGSEIRAYANGHLITTIYDNSFLGARQVGLIVTTFDEENYDVRFDNFAVYPYPCGGGMGAPREVSGRQRGRRSRRRRRAFRQSPLTRSPFSPCPRVG